MAARPPVPGMRWSLWLRHEAVRTGTLAGIYLSCVFVAWLEVANRVRELEMFAEFRNLAAAVLFVSIRTIPALRFRHEPAKMFLAGLTAWTLLTVTYLAAGLHFKLLENRMGFLHVFMLGVVSYGFVAVLDWVFLICAAARQQHMAESRVNAAIAGRHRAR